MRGCLVLSVVLLLAGCGGNDGLTRTFTLSRDAAPDTMAATQVPLSTPPSLADRPGLPGAAASGAGDVQSNEQAAGSAGQQALLEASGPPAPADTRALINRNAGLVYPDPQFVDQVLNWAPQPGYAPLFTQPSKGWLGGLF